MNRRCSGRKRKSSRSGCGANATTLSLISATNKTKTENKQTRTINRDSILDSTLIISAQTCQTMRQGLSCNYLDFLITNSGVQMKRWNIVCMYTRGLKMKHRHVHIGTRSQPCQITKHQHTRTPNQTKAICPKSWYLEVGVALYRRAC